MYVKGFFNYRPFLGKVNFTKNYKSLEEGKHNKKMILKMCLLEWPSFWFLKRQWYSFLKNEAGLEMTFYKKRLLLLEVFLGFTKSSVSVFPLP